MTKPHVGIIAGRAHDALAKSKRKDTADIVKRLRAEGGSKIEWEAADEIERLREVLDRIEKFITAVAPKKLTKELDSIRSEVRTARVP